MKIPLQLDRIYHESSVCRDVAAMSDVLPRLTAKIDRILGQAILTAIQSEYENGLDPRIVTQAVTVALGIHIGRAFLLSEPSIEAQTDSEAERFNKYMLSIMRAARMTVDKTRDKEGFPFGG